MTRRQEIGNLGEDIAVKHLVKLGYVISDRNYRKPWGEIDVIAKKNSILHFIEVKSVSRENNLTEQSDSYMPEDNVHEWKLQRLHRVINSYLNEVHASEDQDWQIDVMAIFLDLKQKTAKIRLTEDI